MNAGNEKRRWMRGMATGQRAVELILTAEDFERSMGREPEDDEEFDAWACKCEESLLDGSIDWDMVFEYARCALEKSDDADP